MDFIGYVQHLDARIRATSIASEEILLCDEGDNVVKRVGWNREERFVRCEPIWNTKIRFGLFVRGEISASRWLIGYLDDQDVDLVAREIAQFLDYSAAEHKA